MLALMTTYGHPVEAVGMVGMLSWLNEFLFFFLQSWQWGLTRNLCSLRTP